MAVCRARRCCRSTRRTRPTRSAQARRRSCPRGSATSLADCAADGRASFRGCRSGGRTMERLTTNPEVVCAVLEDGAVLLNLESRTYYSLNGVGLEVWQLLDRGLD